MILIMGKRNLIKTNFWKSGTREDCNLYRDELGWADHIKRDAQSDYPEYIFRYCVEIVGYNILFYWVNDGNFYTIETEKSPIEVRRIYPNPDWTGEAEFCKADSDSGPCTSSDGEILATFDSPTQIWGNLHIDGKSIGEILEESLIIDLD
jgi:hypothetical protein